MYDRGVRILVLALLVAAPLGSQNKEIHWEHLSSRSGELPSPGTSREQTLARSTPRSSGTAPDETSVALGAGSLRWPEILRAARAAGVTRYYI